MATKTDYLRGGYYDQHGMLHGISISHDVIHMGLGKSRQRDIRPLCVSINILAHDRKTKLLLHRLSEQLKRLESEHGGTVQAIERLVEAISKQEAKT
jgi:hypothetical protein